MMQANRLTYDDLARMPDDGLRHELIDGVHYVWPSPGLQHQRVAKRRRSVEGEESVRRFVQVLELA
jgi:hypothetical protein